ncbi:HAD family hydrolase [Jatrophihabitans telluris]|uniref:HAD family hydrolase n=1 Tax=Jatrophihabitans telluris TaxID=2038343 RepID=A0ABY4R731_9ACTN|nr:HAD family hydrolase [Jatrophihabitans telluris]UQX90264.1 HAD family hydrolase [Jatrophihabitans telluris]
MTVLVASDLDRTLIYSKGALALSSKKHATLVCVERDNGVEAAFMTAAAATALQQLTRTAVLMPVTTRIPKQLDRVVLPGGRPRFAVAANGGFLFVDGALDRTWSRTVSASLAQVASLHEVWTHVAAACDADWTVKLRNADGMFCYAVVHRAAMPAGFLAEISAWADSRGWSTSLQGRKLYWVPKTLTKAAATLEVARRIDAETVLAAGDSLLDIDLLEAADRGIRPAHGELFDAGWSAPHVVGTESAGVRAGEEICRWFAEQVAASAS